MTKKDPPYPNLPPTKAESAEDRLEELVKNESITHYRIIHNETWAEMYVKDGKTRLYHDGFEAVINYNEGMLHIERRNALVNYDIKKEYEKQNIPVEG